MPPENRLPGIEKGRLDLLCPFSASVGLFWDTKVDFPGYFFGLHLQRIRCNWCDRSMFTGNPPKIDWISRARFCRDVCCKASLVSSATVSGQGNWAADAIDTWLISKVYFMRIIFSFIFPFILSRRMKATRRVSIARCATHIAEGQEKAIFIGVYWKDESGRY